MNKMEKYHDVEKVYWENEVLCLTVNGQNHRIKNILQLSERLAKATVNEREIFEICSTGYGIHWPDLDEDIGVEGLLLGRKSTESPFSLERWLENRKQK